MRHVKDGGGRLPALMVLGVLLANVFLDTSAGAQEPVSLLLKGMPLETSLERRAFLIHLEDLRVADPKPWRRLFDASKSDPESDAAAVRGLGRVGEPGLLVLLREIIEDDARSWTAEGRRAAALATGLFGDRTLLAVLARRCKGAELARALGMIGSLPDGDAERKAVLDALDTKSAADEGSASRHAGSVEARLIYGARVKEPLFAELAAQVLAGDGPRTALAAAAFYDARHEARPKAAHAPLLARHLLHENDEIGAFAAKALARTEGAGEDEARFLAAAFATSPSRLVRIEALRGLGVIKAPGARATVLEALQSEDPHLRRVALETAAALADALEAKDRRGLALFAFAIMEEDPAIDVRRAAVLALAALDPATFTSKLSYFRIADPWQLRAAAAEAARRLPLGEFARLFEVFRDDPDRRVRIGIHESYLDRIEHPVSGIDPLDELSLMVPRALIEDSLFSDPVFKMPLGFTRDSDHVVLSIKAAIGRAIVQLPNVEKRYSFQFSFAELFAAAEWAIPESNVELVQNFVDLAGALPGSKGTAALMRYASSREISTRKRAKALLVQRGASAPPESRHAGKGSLLERENALTLAAEIEGDSVNEVTVVTAKGEIVLELFLDEAPLTVRSFLDLARSRFFDGLLFHRVVPGFVAQAGDPRGDGWGGPGFTLPCEITDRAYRRGTVGMALAGKDTGGSQWFITHTSTPHLDLRYTIFGQVKSGMEVVDQLVPGDRIDSVKVPTALPR